MSPKEIKSLLEVLREHDVSEFSTEGDGTRLSIKFAHSQSPQVVYADQSSVTEEEPEPSANEMLMWSTS